MIPNMKGIAKKLSTAAQEGKIDGVKPSEKKTLTRKDGEYCMPRGEHKNLPVSEVPTDYLKYVLNNWTNIDENLHAAIQNEYESRFDRD